MNFKLYQTEKRTYANMPEVDIRTSFYSQKKNQSSPGPRATRMSLCNKVKKKERKDMPLIRISFGMSDYWSRSNPTQSNNYADNIYCKVLTRQLPPGNQIFFDEELKLLLMDGLVSDPSIFLLF